MHGLREIPDPNAPVRRILRCVRSMLSGCKARVRRLRGIAPQANHNPPFFNYRAELASEPKGAALLCYISQPFHAGATAAQRHDYSNWIMALEIANALNRLGYSVDVVDWTDETFVPDRNYDVFMGMTRNFTRLLPMLNQGTRTIYWATRPEASVELEAIRQRQIALHQRRGCEVPLPDDLLPLLESSDYHKADALMLIGNEVTRRSFHGAQPTFAIANPALPFKSKAPATKDFSTASRHFLFLSSWFLLRKGLDLVLEAFARTPHLHVWICAPVLTEPVFLEEYRMELFHTPNIHTVGWVAMQSPEFDRLCELCGFIVFPSCAEGMSGSVINGMARGLIPVCTPEAGVDPGDFGFNVEGGMPEDLIKALTLASETGPEELAQRSRGALRTVAEHHTPVAFRATLEIALRQCLN